MNAYKEAKYPPIVRMQFAKLYKNKENVEHAILTRVAAIKYEYWDLIFWVTQYIDDYENGEKEYEKFKNELIGMIKKGIL